MTLCYDDVEPVSVAIEFLQTYWIIDDGENLANQALPLIA